MKSALTRFDPIRALRRYLDSRAEQAAYELLAKEDEAMRLRLAQHRLAARQRETREAISHPDYRFNKRYSNDDSIYSHFRAHYLETVRDAEATHRLETKHAFNVKAMRKMASELRVIVRNPDNIIQGPDDAKLDWIINVLNNPEE